MPDIIQLLPDHVANQIAAGEVVQRPSSVVKELLENAIDAGASEVKLIIKDAGKTLVQVVDTGKGMSPTDARMAFERHATSKIRSAEDLFFLQTKGFRGEALASIAAVAQVEMLTRQEGEELGTRLRVEGSQVLEQDVDTCAVGTSIQVKNLFFNIPARRKFLKSDTVEFRHITDEFHRVALAHPTIAFEMFHNGSELFKLPVTQLRQRIVHIFGGKTNEKLVPVKELTELVTVSGYVGKPEYARKTRGEQFFFVNNRYIRNSYLHHAVNAAFEGLIPGDHHPSYFLFMELDPAQIDINIHPTKTEIKFEDEHSLYAIIRSSVKHSLGQFQVAPVLDFDRDANLDTPYAFQNKEARMPQIEVDRNFNPFKEDHQVSGKDRTTSFISGFNKPSVAGWQSLYDGMPSREEVGAIELESDEVTGSLFDEAEGDGSLITWQLQRKYIVTTIKSGLVIVDQQRAHQRVLYEEYLKRSDHHTTGSQQLLFPLELALSRQDTGLLYELRSSLETFGFVFAETPEGYLQLEGIPVGLEEREVHGLIDRVLRDHREDIPGQHYSQSERLALSLCRSLAIRPGDVLHRQARETLVNDLFATSEPTLSPFQKPIFITLSTEELDKKFL